MQQCLPIEFVKMLLINCSKLLTLCALKVKHVVKFWLHYFLQNALEIQVDDRIKGCMRTKHFKCNSNFILLYWFTMWTCCFGDERLVLISWRCYYFTCRTENEINPLNNIGIAVDYVLFCATAEYVKWWVSLRLP